MATKITTAVFALIMGFAINSFAGTPETKGEAKPAEAQSKNTEEPIECYRDANGAFHVKVGTGDCLPELGSYCSYTYDGDGIAGQDQDEANYTPDPQAANSRWQP